MKTLKAFWHWVDNEKPDTSRFNEAAEENLSSNAHAALEFALCSVDSRAGCTFTSAYRAPVMPAVRDLSLEVCRALDEMCDLVEEDCLAGEPVHDGCMDCGADIGHADDCPNVHREPKPGDHAPPYKLLAIDELADWLPAPRACDGPLQGVRVTQADLDRVNAQTGGSLSFANTGSGWVKMQQLANMSGYPMLGRPVMNDDGLKLRPEPSWVHTYHGRTGSDWDSVDRRLEVFTSIDRGGVDRLRGLTPRTIIVRGRVKDYAPDVLAYLSEVIQPMACSAGAIVTTPNDSQLIPALGFP